MGRVVRHVIERRDVALLSIVQFRGGATLIDNVYQQLVYLVHGSGSMVVMIFVQIVLCLKLQQNMVPLKSTTTYYA